MNIDPKLLIYFFMGIIIIWFLITFNSHRILIRKQYNTTNGVVYKAGRYKKIIDKKLDLEYLKPMFGNKWLPVAINKAFQRCDSVPIIGCNRVATYLFPTSIPSAAILPNSTIIKFKIKRWIYMRERYKIIKKEKRDNFLKFMATYAAVIIVISCFAFFSFLIFLEIKNDQLIAAQLKEMVGWLEHKFTE